MRADAATPQTAALFEVALCIVQALHERDPAIARSINFAAGKAYNRLKERGEDEAADIVYRFGRGLLDRALFPDTTGTGEE